MMNYNLINPFFDEFFQDESNSRYNSLMKTDIKDYEDRYEFLIEVPGVNKEDIKISLNDGYLTVEAKQAKNEDEAKYLRQERYFGSYKRSFYVDDEVKADDIKAKLENGVLTLACYKKKEEAPVERFISIE